MLIPLYILWVVALVPTFSLGDNEPDLDGFVVPFGSSTRARNGTLATLSTSSLISCGEACNKNETCIAVNYDGSSCELVGFAKEFGIESVDSWTYYAKLRPRDDSRVVQKISPSCREPLRGEVELQDGRYKVAFDNNLEYLRSWITGNGTDNLLFFFRVRAGKTDVPGQGVGWDCGLRGSLASMFLMGSGNALQWTEDVELRSAMERVVDGIRSSVNISTGYAAAFNENLTSFHENPSYVTSWLAHGLIEAEMGGAEGALSVIRGHLSWFANSTQLPLFLPADGGNHPIEYPTGYGSKGGGSGATNGHLIYLIYQGMPAHSQMALSSMGTQADVDLLTSLYLEKDWYEALLAKNPSAIWHRNFFPHNYEGTAMESIADMYFLTGEEYYLNITLAWYDLLNSHWIDPASGVIMLNELMWYPPNSYYLSFDGYDPHGWLPNNTLHDDFHGVQPPCFGPQTKSSSLTGEYHGYPIGEYCGHSFLIRLLRRFRRLFPQHEPYTAQIERSLINVALAQDAGGIGIRHFTSLHKHKMNPRCLGE